MAYLENGLDFFTGVKIEVYKDAKVLSSLKALEDKRRFILSFCQNALDYDIILNFCKERLAENDEGINVATLQGLTYLVMRFQKIDFDGMSPIIKKYLTLEDERYIYAEGLLAEITIIIPSLRDKAVRMLRDIDSRYCELYNL